MQAGIKIGELARRTRCPVETIRFYEKEGILPPPPRSAENNYRLYGKTHVEHLLFVRRCRSFDMALQEIKQLLQLRATPQSDCTAASTLLDQRIDQVSTRISELGQLKVQLEALRLRCGGSSTAEQCGILEELGSSELNRDE